MKSASTMAFALCLFITSLSAVAEDKKQPNYGVAISLTEAMTVDIAIKQYNQIKDEVILLKGKVDKICQKKGCWMTLKSNGVAVRVTFKDYGFFVPGTIIGKHVLAQGQLVESTMSVAQARHFAEDAGLSDEEIDKITDPTKEYRFVATGVSELSS